MQRPRTQPGSRITGANVAIKLGSAIVPFLPRTGPAAQRLHYCTPNNMRSGDSFAGQEIAPSRSERLARLTDWRPVADNASLAGRATIAFSGGWIVAFIPIFRRADGGLSAGAPSMPILAADGTHQRDEHGKRRYAPVISFADRDARERWDQTVLGALRDGGIAPAAAGVAP